MTIGGYLRISKDDTSRAKRRVGADLAVNDAIERQREDVLDLLDEVRWDDEVVWYIDRDISAYHERTRPEFEHLLEDLASGQIAGIVCYHADRLARQRSDSDRIVRLYRKLGGAKFATLEGPLDLLTERGEDALVDAIEGAYRQSRASSRRVTRKHAQNARDGVPVGGLPPFGWLADKRTLHPQHAPLLREMIDKALAGEKLHRLCHDLAVREVPTARGGTWTRATVRAILTNPRLCGWRTYRGKILYDRDGQPVVGQWQTVCTVDEYQRLIEMYPQGASPVRGRRYLLSGILRCGREGCLSRLTGYANERDGHTYGCHARSDGGCGGVGVDGPKADAAITELVLAHLESLDLGAASPTPFAKATDLLDAQGRLRETQRAFGAGEISASLAFPMLSDLERRIDALRSEQREHAQQVMSIDTTDLRGRWETMPLDGKRRVILAALPAVIVMPARGRGYKFDVTRLRPQWS